MFLLSNDGESGASRNLTTLSVSDDPNFQPPQVFAEGAWLYGSLITAMLYGVVIVLYGLCMRSLLIRVRSRDGPQRKQWFFLAYVNAIFVLNTIFVAANCHTTLIAFINERDYPGGPSAYDWNTSSAPENIAFILSNWSTDALMIWRCIVVYRDSIFYPFVIGFGCLILLASFVSGSYWLYIALLPARPATAFFGSLFPYITITFAIHICICVLTVLRLLYHRACISKVLGPKYGALYASIAAMVVESASVYSISVLLYLIPYAVKSPLANATMQIVGEAQAIAPLLIVYRVVEGKAWTRGLARRLAISESFVLRGLPTQSAPGASMPPGELDGRVVPERLGRVGRPLLGVVPAPG